MFNPTSSRAILGGSLASLPGTSTTQRKEITSSQATTNKERAKKRFEEELKKLKGQGNHSDNEFVENSSMNAALKLFSASNQPGENEQYAKALLIAIREEIYKKGYKSSNKLRAAPPGEDENQWKKKEVERRSKAREELGRIRKNPPFGTPYYHRAIQEIIRNKNTIEAKGHNCGDLSKAGIGILDAAGIKDAHCVAFRNFDHQMILIGKISPRGLPLDMEKWPSHLAICDPWANIVCPAKDFVPAFVEKMQKWESDGKKIYDIDTETWVNPLYPNLEKKLRNSHKTFDTPLINKELRDTIGRTLLMAAASAGKVDDVHMLLNEGADIEAKDNNGFSPLLFAVHKGNAKILDVLLKAGANIETKDNKGETALMKAVQMATSNSEKWDQIGPQILKTLLVAGADVTVRDKNGKAAHEYAIDLAIAKGDNELLALIETALQKQKNAAPGCFSLFAACVEFMAW